MVSIEDQLMKMDLHSYKLYELANLSHGLAKLRFGSSELYRVLFAELECRTGWDPQSVAQVLDTMRRNSACRNQSLVLLLMQWFVDNVEVFQVHPLTQSAWCLV